MHLQPVIVLVPERSLQVCIWLVVCCGWCMLHCVLCWQGMVAPRYAVPAYTTQATPTAPRPLEQSMVMPGNGWQTKGIRAPNSFAFSKELVYLNKLSLVFSFVVSCLFWYMCTVQPDPVYQIVLPVLNI